MTIKRKLLGTTAFCLTIALVMAWVLGSTSRRGNEALTQNRRAGEIVKGVFELSVVTNDYFLHHEERAQQQWQSRHDSLGTLLQAHLFNTPSEQALVGRIRQDHERMRTLFSELLGVHQQHPANTKERAMCMELEDRLVARMMMKSQEMGSRGLKLANISVGRMQGAQRAASLAVMVSVVFVAAAVSTTSVLIARAVLKPVSELQKGTEIVGTGDLDYRVGASAHDEIGQLSRAFDRMTERLKAVTVSRDELGKEAEQERQEAEARRAKESTAVAAILNDILRGEADEAETEKRVLDACLAATDSAYGMVGVINEHGQYDTTTYSSRTLQDCAFPEALAWELSRGMPIRGIWGWPMLHGEPLLCNDLPAHPDRVGLPEGHVALQCFLGVPLKRDGETVGMVAVANKPGGYTEEDKSTLVRLGSVISLSRQHRRALEEAQRTSAELQRLVAALDERTREVEAVNQELQAFAYSVSHDLRAPLRSMDGFSQVLLEDYADKVDEQGKDHLQRVRAACHTMGQLIDDLLKLSRITRAEMKWETVNLSDLAQETVRALRQGDPEREVEWIIQDEVTAKGDPNLLRIVLENLLGNAWKFTGKGPRAKIEFGSAEHEGEAVYFVRDDGVGFDMAYVDKLFGAFQRLHSTADFAGTGIGLATVQRIVRRHGGRVWAEGAVQQGATFYFTL